MTATLQGWLEPQCSLLPVPAPSSRQGQWFPWAGWSMPAALCATSMGLLEPPPPGREGPESLEQGSSRVSEPLDRPLPSRCSHPLDPRAQPELLPLISPRSILPCPHLETAQRKTLSLRPSVLCGRLRCCL